MINICKFINSFQLYCNTWGSIAKWLGSWPSDQEVLGFILGVATLHIRTNEVKYSQLSGLCLCITLWFWIIVSKAVCLFISDCQYNTIITILMYMFSVKIMKSYINSCKSLLNIHICDRACEYRACGHQLHPITQQVISP